MKKFKVGILGATGAVGQMMMQVLAERDFPIEELRLFASPRSVGKTVDFQGETLVLQQVNKKNLTGLNLVLGAVDNQWAKKYAPMVIDANAIFIDNSSAFRLDSTVPLVIPEINSEQLKRHHGIIANPNCATIIALMAVHAIHQLSPIESMVVSTYQAVSGAGNQGLAELEEQLQAHVMKKTIAPKVFTKPIAMNVIPQIGNFLENGYSSEEMKLHEEGRKILGSEILKVSCTCVRVPVLRCHCEAIQLKTKEPLNLKQVKDAIARTRGVVLMEDLATPDQFSNQDQVGVARVRQDMTDEKGLLLWCCGDQLRKGAATNAVQIAQKLIELNLLK